MLTMHQTARPLFTPRPGILPEYLMNSPLLALAVPMLVPFILLFF